MGKNIKVMPHSHSPFSLGKGGKPYGKTSKYPHLLAKNIVWLTVHIASKFNHIHSFLNLQQNFQTKFSCPFYTLAKSQQIKQNLLNLPTWSANYTKFTPFVNSFTLCFRHLPRQRTLRNSSELCKFCAVCPHGPRIT